jgi:hypothetical protein
MSQTESSTGAESIESQDDDPIVGLDTGEALASVWQYWVVAVVTAGLTVLFLTTDLWGNGAEIFYAVIFTAITLIVVGAGVVTAHSRTRTYNF